MLKIVQVLAVLILSTYTTGLAFCIRGKKLRELFEKHSSWKTIDMLVQKIRQESRGLREECSVGHEAVLDREDALHKVALVALLDVC